jgi:ABC-type transport system substrate-binding protein
VWRTADLKITLSEFGPPMGISCCRSSAAPRRVLIVYTLFISPASFEKAGRDWGRVATLPPAGTGPFRLSKVLPREMAELTRNEGYWDSAHRAKLDVIRLLPIPDPNSRVAALRSGQVDWIEAPPPDGIPSLGSRTSRSSVCIEWRST